MYEREHRKISSINTKLLQLQDSSSLAMAANNTQIHDLEAERKSCIEPYLDPICQFCNSYLPPKLFRKVIAEVIATFMLVFVTCGSAAISGSDETAISKLGASAAGGLIVTVMIYAVGHISGAHMNPAVTFAFAAVRHFPWKQVPFYIAAQLAGSVIASFTLRELLHPISNLGTTTPSGSDFQAFVMEIVVTFLMMFVASAVATDTKAIGELAGIAVGSAVTITSILAGPISGGSMNPARTLGPALASNRYKGLWVYILGPVVGTLMGAWSYSLTRLTHEPLHALSLEEVPSSFKIRRRNSDLETAQGEFVVQTQRDRSSSAPPTTTAAA